MSDVKKKIADLKRQVDQVKGELQKERQAHLDAIAEIDEQLAELGERPAKRTYKARTSKAPTTPRAEGPAAPPQVMGPADDSTAQALNDLRPFWGILSERSQKVVQLRSTGKLPAEIGKLLILDKGVVSNTVFMSRKLMQEAKDKQAKAEAENAG